MKDNVIYNHAENEVYVKTEQVKQVIDKLCDNHIFIEYEEWDEDDDKKFIVTFSLEEIQELN